MYQSIKEEPGITALASAFCATATCSLLRLLAVSYNSPAWLLRCRVQWTWRHQVTAGTDVDCVEVHAYGSCNCGSIRWRSDPLSELLSSRSPL